MPQVTVGGVTFCNPDLTYREFRPLVPSSLVQHILALNPTVTRSSFTKRVIMGSYVHLIEDNRAKAIASGLKPRSRRTMRNKMREVGVRSSELSYLLTSIVATSLLLALPAQSRHLLRTTAGSSDEHRVSQEQSCPRARSHKIQQDQIQLASHSDG